MKIKNSIGEAQQDAAKIIRQNLNAREKAADAAVSQKSGKGSSTDSVDVTMAKMISDQLDPTKMAAERRDKIERLKKLIASGEYKPSSEAVAQAVLDEVSFEIAGAGSIEKL